jgi:hypothetical protein
VLTRNLSVPAFAERDSNLFARIGAQRGAILNIGATDVTPTDTSNEEL